MPTIGQLEKLVPASQPKAPPQVGNVQVFCRFRPLNSREKGMGEKDYSVAKFLDDKVLEVQGT